MNHLYRLNIIIPRYCVLPRDFSAKIVMMLLLLLFGSANALVYDPNEAFRMLVYSSAAYRIGTEKQPIDLINQERPGEAVHVSELQLLRHIL